MIIAGLGFRKSADTNSLRDALIRAGGQNATALATAADKANAAPLRQLAAELGLKIHAIPATLLAIQPVLTHSPRVAQLYGTGSLAEAAALAAAGPGAKLQAPRVTSQDGKATAALATGA
jgi:cobalt-precorrin 5A hydrolase